MNFGEAITLLRKTKGWSQLELQEKIGISQTALSKIENGVNDPGKETICRICEAMGIPTAALYLLAMDKPSLKRIPQKQSKQFRSYLAELRHMVLLLAHNNNK